MRPLIKEFAQICAATLPFGEPVYEFGALQVRGQEGFADLRPLFPGTPYVGADMRPGPGVDIILDLHDVRLPPESVGSALMLDTLEHVEHPRRAVAAVHRVLRSDGMLVVSSVMNFPIHGHPHDYWRFTPEGFRSLLTPFASCFVECAGEARFPHTVVGIGFKGGTPEATMGEFTRRMGQWKTFWSDMVERRWKRLARLTVSPLRVDIYREFRGRTP